MGLHGQREKISDPGGARTNDLRNRSPFLYQFSYVQGQMGAGHWKLRWLFAANEHVGKGVTSKIWSLITIKHI